MEKTQGKTEDILSIVLTELARADAKHPPMNGNVEGMHTIKCELAELDREISREYKDANLIQAEAIQVAAMAIKFLRDCCGMQLETTSAQTTNPIEALPDHQGLSLRGQDWVVFSNQVLEHIEGYTVPQYGDRGSDRAGEYTLEQIAEHIGRYKDRMGSNSRGTTEAVRDLLKIAHYAQMGHRLLVEMIKWDIPKGSAY